MTFENLFLTGKGIKSITIYRNIPLIDNTIKKLFHYQKIKFYSYILINIEIPFVGFILKLYTNK